MVQREAAVGRPVWDSQRLLHQVDDLRPEPSSTMFVKDSASRSLAHVFTLLALVLPAEPLQIAFRGLHTDDQHLRGTALEYLEGVLPPPIRASLWPYLEDRAHRSGEDAAARADSRRPAALAPVDSVEPGGTETAREGADTVGSCELLTTRP